MKKNVDEHGLLPDEQVVNEHIYKAVQAYVALPVQHPSEPTDFTNAVHILQQLLALRVVRRAYPDGWPTHTNE